MKWDNSYHLFFGSFDGVVLIATILILFPREQTELRHSALQQFQWTIVRFAAMQDRNPYARAGLGILKAILAKLTRSIDSEPSPASMSASWATSDTPATTWSREAPSVSTPSGGSGIRSLGGGVGSLTQTSTPDYATRGDGDDGNSANFDAAAAAADWSMLNSDALASLAPLFPTSDLIFNDLNAIFDTNPSGNAGGFAAGLEDAAAAAAAAAPPEAMAGGDSNGNGSGEPLDLGLAFPAQFGGGFGEDTVWQFLNQYQPGTSV